MSTTYRYTLPVDQTEWKFDGNTETCFTWEYDEPREALLQLYTKGKKQQWDAAERIDWSLDLDPENPMLLDDRVVHIYGTDLWNRMTPAEKSRVRHHLQASQISQFMHGEQGALIATAKIIQTVPNLVAKFYAATQVIDEARHVEAYSRLSHEKFELAYPITSGLKALLEDGLSDSRWDMTYLTMQILIEGLALAAFQRIRDQSKNPLAAAVNAYVMQDEARHVAFGRLALRDYYPQLGDAERKEREPPLRAALQGLDHPGQVIDRQPESPGAHAALPDAEDRYPGVGVPAQPHTPGIAPDVEEDLTEARQRRCVGRGHEAYGGPN